MGTKYRNYVHQSDPFQGAYASYYGTSIPNSNLGQEFGFPSDSKRLTVHYCLLVIPTRSSNDLTASVQTLELEEHRYRSYQIKCVYIYWT